jgi:hypothetical protein
MAVRAASSAGHLNALPQGSLSAYNSAFQSKRLQFRVLFPSPWCDWVPSCGYGAVQISHGDVAVLAVGVGRGK